MLCKDLPLDLFFPSHFYLINVGTKQYYNCFKLSSECETVFGNYAMCFFIFLLQAVVDRYVIRKKIGRIFSPFLLIVKIQAKNET
jgi:hypothetical protein